MNNLKMYLILFLIYHGYSSRLKNVNKKWYVTCNFRTETDQLH